MKSARNVGSARIEPSAPIGSERTEPLTPGWWKGKVPALLLGVWFGMATGLLELALLVVRVEVFERGVFLRSAHFLWMIPVSDLALFGACGLVLGLAAQVWPRRAPGLVVGSFVFLSCLSQLLLVRGLDARMCILFAVGGACQATPLLLARWPRVLPGMRRSIPVLFGILVVLVGWAFGRESFSKARAARPSASRPVPNVLLITLDAVRADRLGLYGYDRDTTPNLARLAARGVRFDRAHAAAPWTLPSHASLLTGRWPHELAIERHGRLDAAYPILAEFLRDRGYSTAGVVANQFWCGQESGLARGFGDYFDYPVTPGAVFRSSTLGWLVERTVNRAFGVVAARLTADAGRGVSLDFQRKDAAEVNREFLGWLSRHRERPFFAFLNYFDAHDPYLVPEGFHRHFGRAPKSRADFVLLRDWQKRASAASTPGDVALASDSYDDCIAALDQELGKLFGELTRRGLLERTVVIVTADHGEEFGEHGYFRHGFSLYESEIRVPLMIVAPNRIPAGRVVRAPVSLRDLPATVADVIGWQAESPFPGSSLARTWQAPAASNLECAEPPLSEMVLLFEPTSEHINLPGLPGPSQALIAKGKVYIHHEDAVEELYDLDTDPTESRNLSGSADLKPVLAHFRQVLDRLLKMAVRTGKVVRPVPSPDAGAPG